MAEATFGFCSTQAIASCGMESPASVGDRLEVLDAGEDVVAQQALDDLGAALVVGGAAALGAGWPGRYLPLSTPCAIGDQTICEMPSSSEAGTTLASMTRHSMEYCGWLEISWKPSSLDERVALAELLRRPLADADVQRLALPDDVGERLHGLFQRRFVVVAVGLVEVHVVRLQPAERAVDRLHDVLAGQAHVVLALGAGGPVRPS